MAFMQGSGGEQEINLAQRYAQQAQENIYHHYGAQNQGGGPENISGFDRREGHLVEFTSRGETWSDLISCVSSPLLRLGLLTQLLVLGLGSALYYGHGGSRIFTFDSFSMPEDLRSSETFSTIMILLGSANLFGCLCMALFQVYVADNSKMSRGFRAGSKLLSSAVMLDLLVVGFRLMQYIYSHRFLGVRWWLKYTQSSADWCLFHSGAILHAVALVLYGLAFFYMESYHDEGTYEEWAWAMAFLYALAGLFELSLALTGFGAFYTVILLLALASSTLWAFSFEPLLHYYSPQMHDRDCNQDVCDEK